MEKITNYKHYLMSTGKKDSRTAYREYLEEIVYAGCPYPSHLREALINREVWDSRCWNTRFINSLS